MLAVSRDVVLLVSQGASEVDCTAYLLRQISLIRWDAHQKHQEVMIKVNLSDAAAPNKSDLADKPVPSRLDL